jgi:hypothetical protein
MCRMNSSDGMSSNVGVVSFATVDNSMSDDDASVDGNGGMWIIDGDIVSLSFLGLQPEESQVFRRLQEDNTERLSPFDPSIIMESVVAVAAVAIVTSMLNINFFIMIEKNAYIFHKRIGSHCFVVDVAAVETWCSVPAWVKNSLFTNLKEMGYFVKGVWSYESIGARTILSCTRTIQPTHSLVVQVNYYGRQQFEINRSNCHPYGQAFPSMREMIQSKLINNSGTLEWIERAKSLVFHPTASRWH